MTATWDRARAIADAVLYEGYLLYPYRATSSKNQSRWQFGVLGPAGASDAGVGEDDTLSAQFLIDGDSELTLIVRFLQLQHRRVERDTGGGRFEAVGELTSGMKSWVTWDEAVERELRFGPFELADLVQPRTLDVVAPDGRDTEEVDGGRLIRTRAAIHAELSIAVERDFDVVGLHRVSVSVRNTGAPVADKGAAIATSLIGTHVIGEVVGGEFVSLLEPPDSAASAVSRCVQHRCFPVLAGRPGERDLILISPIILYDHPEIAEQSEGALYDSTEIDEILTLRVMTMTDEEKAQARATDPLAAQLIDRCDAMSPEAMQQLHGILRNPHASEGTGFGELDEQMRSAGLIPEVPDGVDWWDPLADTIVRPDIDAVLVNGTRVAAGSRVRLRPSRRADAQDIFFAGKTARVTSVHEDVDGEQYVGVIVEDDPDFEMPDSYGRYLYFTPDEVEPLEARIVSPDRSS
jgi:hypothetical protein